MLQLSAHLGFLFTDRPWQERPQAAADAGFAAVDIFDPATMALADMARAIEKAGVSVIQISTTFGDREAGELGLCSLPDRRDDFRANCRQVVDYGRVLGARVVHAIAGKPDKRFEPEVVRATYLENLAFAADLFGGHDLTLAIEPINPVANPGFYLDSLDRALDAIDAIGRDRVKLLFDTYHMAMIGVDPPAVVGNVLDRIAHIHIGDAPLRNEPGSSTIDFDRFFRTLEESAYAGWVSCEYVPAGDSAAGLAWVDRYGLRLGGERPF